MANDPFQDLARDLPDDAFWITGAWFKKLFAALTADRARAGANIDEHPSDKGRFFNAKAGETPDAGPLFFEILDDGTSTSKARIVASSLAGDLPDGFNVNDTPVFTLPVSDGDKIYAHLSYDTGSGALKVNTREFLAGPSMPPDDPTSPDFYYLLGTVAVSAKGKVTGTNYVYGPIDAVAYRNWFADPPTYSPIWNAAL